MSFGRFIKNFEILDSSPALLHKNQDKYQTFIGLFLTIVTLTLAISTVYRKIDKFLFNIDPIITTQIDYSDLKDYLINNTFTIGITFSQS